MNGFIVISIETLSKFTIKNFPFINRLSKENGSMTGSLIPNAGYINCHGWMSGLTPQECAQAFRYIYEENPNRLNKTPNVLSEPENLPVIFQDKFSFAETQNLNANDYWLNRGKSNLTIFQYANLVGLKQHVSIWPKRIELEGVVDWLIEGVKSEANFIFCEIGDCDGIGHRYGTSSDQYRKVCQIIDEKIEIALTEIQGSFSSYDFLIFGDNGMTTVSNYIDIRKLLSGVENSETFLFIDAVITRVWTKCNRSLNLLQNTNWHNLNLIQLDNGMKNYLKLNLEREIIGDFAIMSPPGSMFYPNYFTKSRERGTHGYGALSSEEMSYFIHKTNGFNECQDQKVYQMTHIYKLICREIEQLQAKIN